VTDKVYVAKLGRAVGLKGQQKIIIESDFPEQFKKNSKFLTNKNQELIVESYNPNSDTIKFAGIDSVEEAKKLTNKELFTTAEQSKINCQLEKNQFFWFDIIGCDIVQNKELLGKVIDVQRLPLDDYFIIETNSLLIEQDLPKSFMIPYIDNFIISVDIENKTIEVKNSKDILEAS